jgi:hypothetical protein
LMIVARLFFLSVGLGMCLLTGCIVRASNSSAVQQAHREHEAAHEIFDREMDSARGTDYVRNACKSLLTRLKAIDVSKCPVDYQEQFDDYLSELKDVCKTLESHPDQPPESPAERSAGDQSQQRLLDGIEKMNQSGEKLRDIAKEYGATVGH